LGDVGKNGAAGGGEAERGGEVGAADGVVERECGGLLAFEGKTFGAGGLDYAAG